MQPHLDKSETYNMGWDENQKFVLEKLEWLESNQKDSDKHRREEHERLYAYVHDVDAKIHDKMDKVRDDLIEAIGNTDKGEDVSRLKAVQKVIASALTVVISLIAYFHFDIDLPL